ncbi:hypothetical protein [Bacteroides sp. 519]|uniref:hypothetical protein n=1 Tax=Bacteroides sp. 519 TaxID=2302937 RepID=UPI0013CFEDB1|nr:hypothetical protein [Bacteroides sp. 519]
MKLHIFFLLLICCSLTACHQRVKADIATPDTEIVPAVYYWKTVFSLNNYEKEFLKIHNIQKIYLRFFDVDYESDWGNYNIVPVGTLQFKDTIPSGIEVIPTIFITNDAMKKVDIHQLAYNIVWRVFRMVDTNNISNIKEIQFDCDWTQSTQQKYFDFLQKVKDLLKDRPIQLSATIRLHQLTLPVPPVERGVLMCYNTGNIKKKDTENSILNISDIEPYIRRLGSYKLPLSIAYPTFSWTVGFRDDKFLALFRQINLDDTEHYEKRDNNIYLVKQGHYLEHKWLYYRDILRVEESSYSMLSKVKTAIDNQLSSLKQKEIIIYHLDSINLSKYSDHEIQTLYRP